MKGLWGKPLAWALNMELWQNSVFMMQLNIQTLLARTRKSILDVELSIEWRVSFMHDVSLLSMFHVLEKGALWNSARWYTECRKVENAYHGAR